MSLKPTEGKILPDKAFLLGIFSIQFISAGVGGLLVALLTLDGSALVPLVFVNLIVVSMGALGLSIRSWIKFEGDSSEEGAN